MCPVVIFVPVLLWKSILSARFQGEPLPTLKAIETLEETSTRDVKLKRGDEYVETC